MSTSLRFKTSYVVFFVFAAMVALSHPCSGNSTNQTGNSWAWPMEKWNVHVANQMGDVRTLVTHCKSKDDDLGIHDVSPGSDFNWSFKVNIAGTTLFWCYVHNDHQHANFQVFWVENEEKTSWLHYRCRWKSCIWVAKDDGIYIRNSPESRDEIQHQWEPGW